MNTQQEQDDHGKSQARAQIESIVEMVAAMGTEAEDGREEGDAQELIQSDPLSVQIRSGWYAPGGDNAPEEFKILLCWGGPACQIIGDLSEHSQPENPRLQHQDWGTPWTDYPLTDEEETALQTYCEQFYFGED